MIGSIKNIEPGFMNDYCNMQIFDNETIICAMHLPSGIYSREDDIRLRIAQDIKIQIEDYKKTKGINKVILVGDFNENPYQYTIMGINGFNGLPISENASKGTRKIAGKKEDLYYNPMWNFFGDYEYPYGTYYYSDSPHWFIFDQVLISAPLIEKFCKDKLEIVTRIGDLSLKNKKGTPNKREYSDHFPIIFEIEER